MEEGVHSAAVRQALEHAQGRLECPLCQLEKRATLGALRHYLGEALMMPNVRKRIRLRGFSRDHWRLLLQDPRRLELGLAAESRWKAVLERVEEPLSALMAAAQRVLQSRHRWPIRSGELQRASKRVEREIQMLRSTCLVEDSVRQTMEGYCSTLVRGFTLFQDLLSRCTLCFPHLGPLLALATQTLSTTEAAEFTQVVTRATLQGWRRALEDLESFLAGFDSGRGLAPGPGNAPETVVALLEGWIKNRDPREERFI